MRALRELRRFILIKASEGSEGEIRPYIVENVESLARVFHVPTRTILDAVEGVADDHSLATKFLETVRRAEDFLRERRKENRARSAQLAAEAIGASAQWDGGKVSVDILRLVSSALTRRSDVIMFVGDGFAVGVNQSVLFDLARLKRRDLTAFVDQDGLHIRWFSGGLNLYPQSNSQAEKVVVPLPAMPAVVAA